MYVKSKFCSFCGNKLMWEAVICPSCKRKTDKKLYFLGAQEVEFCWHCGADVNEGTSICSTCGCRIFRQSKIIKTLKNGIERFHTSFGNFRMKYPRLVALSIIMLSLAVLLIAALIILEKCPTCNGTGFQQCIDCTKSNGIVDCSECHGTSKAICKECSGGGKTKCSSCVSGHTRCEVCTGSGSKGKTECDNCSGDGELIFLGDLSALSGFTSDGYYSYAECSDCNGTGQVNIVCPSCSGEGKVKCETCSGSGQLKCVECSGSGETGDCLVCNKTGKVICPNCGGDSRYVCEKCSGFHFVPFWKIS